MTGQKNNQGLALAHESAVMHVSGEARYVDDIPEQAATCYVALGLSDQAHARIEALDLSSVREAPGVIDVFAAGDIP